MRAVQKFPQNVCGPDAAILPFFFKEQFYLSFFILQTNFCRSLFEFTARYIHIYGYIMVKH